MAVKFYMDEQVPGEITRELRRWGVDVFTTQEDAREGAADPLVLDRASELERVLFTMDADFLRHTVDRQRRGLPFRGVVYGHQLHLTIGQCVECLQLISEGYDPADMENRLLYLPSF
jgi:hypothetical protein